jgi:hypothetical protein
MALSSQGGMPTAMQVWIGITVIIVLIKVRRPEWRSKRPLQVGSRSPILSSSGCQAILGSLETPSGIPRYLMGKSTFWHGKIDVAKATCSGVQRIGASWHFCKLQPRPEHCSTQGEGGICHIEVPALGCDEPNQIIRIQGCTVSNSPYGQGFEQRP